MRPARLQTDVLRHEKQAKRQGFRFVIGIDEAGRGPLAGPVVAAAVSLKSFSFKTKIKDSKKLSPGQREKAFYEIYNKAYVGVGIVSEAAIDDLNILNATFAAMTNAVWQLIGRLPPKQRQSASWQKGVLLLVDGNRFKSDLPFAHQAIVGGDDTSLSIACASIIAKVTRDRILQIYHHILPEYNFAQHKGYPTRAHKKAIQKYGFSFLHRRTFQAAV